MRYAIFGGEETMKLSSRSFRLTGTLLVLMLPIFFIGRVLQLHQQTASVALGALGVSAVLAAIVGIVAAIWNR
jgi:hypothetical protein